MTKRRMVRIDAREHSRWQGCGALNASLGARFPFPET